MQWLEKFFVFIYARDLGIIIWIIGLCILIWGGLAKYFVIKSGKKDFWIWVNRICFFGMVFAILYSTVFSRNTSFPREIYYIPFHSFIEARIQPELYRSMFMNVFLFVPFGLTMPFGFGENKKHPIGTTVLKAFICSVFIEILQYTFALGRAEIDDALCNTLGAAVGTIPYYLANRKRLNYTKWNRNEK